MATKKKVAKKKAKKKVVKKKTARKKAVKSSATVDNRELCFAIMPFGGWFDDYYTTIYCPAIENAGLKPCRADDLYRPSTIVHDIWSYTKRAKLILADLTGKNANVFYELGLAHALAKPAILVVENMDDVPFDLRALRIIEYDKNAPNWGDVLKDKIETSIREVMDSPAQSVLPAFLEVKESSKKTTVTEREKELIEMRQDIDMLRRELSVSRKRRAPDEIDPDTADAMVRNYLNHGMSESMIVRRLSERGAPSQWVQDKISEIRHENRGDIEEIRIETHPVTRKKVKLKKKIALKKKVARKKVAQKGMTIEHTI